MKKPLETKKDSHGPLRLVVEAEGFVMVRRPRCRPLLLSREEWAGLDETKTATVYGVRQ